MRKLWLVLAIIGLATVSFPVFAQTGPEVATEEATSAGEEETLAEETRSPIPQAIEEAPPEYLYPGILPDHPLYSLKSLLYKIKGFFVFGDLAKANWFLKMADKRAAEARGLVDKGKEDLAAEALEKAVSVRDKASDHLQAAKTAGKDVADLIEKLEATSLRQQAILDYVLEKIPEPAREAIEQAKENSRKGHERAIEALKEKMEKEENKEKERSDDEGEKEREREEKRETEGWDD